MMLRQAGVRESRRASWRASAIPSGAQCTSARWWKNAPPASIILCTVGQTSPASPEERPAPSWMQYAVERVVASVVVLWLGLTLVFVLFYVVPADPAKQFAGKGANAESIAKAKHVLGLDHSWLEQYRLFLTRTLEGDFGYSWYNR